MLLSTFYFKINIKCSILEFDMAEILSLSIVATIYKSEKTIQEFLRRISYSANNLVGENFEIILVNDGSPDNSFFISLEESKKLKKVKIIDLSRNFGHHKAMMAGLSYASGKVIFLIDSDLEEMPEIIEEFWAEFKKNDVDVVYGVQKKRKGKIFERLSGAIYFRLFRYITKLKFPENVLTARIMTSKYVDSLLLYKESELYLIGLWHLTGFKQMPIFVNKNSLTPSSYTFRKSLSLAINSVVSFSDRPLKLIFYLGLIVTTLVIVYALNVFFNFIINGYALTGWTSLILSIWFFGGLSIMILGILGIYLSKIFIETKNRPFLIVKNTYINGIKKPFQAKIKMNKF